MLNDLKFFKKSKQDKEKWQKGFKDKHFQNSQLKKRITKIRHLIFVNDRMNSLQFYLQ